MKSIVTLTVNAAIDVAASVPKVFPNHKLRCGVARRDPGGGGLNVSRAIRLLGGDSLACYLAGGPSGDMLDALLDDEALPHRRLPIKGWTRESFTATEEETGHQFRFVLRGPELSMDEWQWGLDDSPPSSRHRPLPLPAAASRWVCRTISMAASRGPCRHVVPASSSTRPARRCSKQSVRAFF